MRCFTVITAFTLSWSIPTAPLHAADPSTRTTAPGRGLAQDSAPRAPVGLHGTGALSLPQLLEEARRANPELLASRKRWEAAQAKVSLSTALPAPKIGIEWEEIPRGTIKVNQATLMYQLIQSIPFPGKLSARRAVAVKEAQVAAMAFKQAEWEIASQVKAVYYDLFLLDREREIQEEQVAWIRQAAEAVQAKYATGTATQAELLRAQAELLSASNTLSILGHKRQAMEAHLNHLLNRHVHAPVGSLEMISLTPISYTPDELMVIAQQRQPELLAFQFTAERAEAAVKLSKRELLPDLETMFELRDPAMGPVGPWDLSLAVAIPFWFWTKWQYGVKIAIRDRQTAHAAFEAMHNEIARRIHEHWHEAMAAYGTATLAHDGLIPLSKQAVASAMAAYQSGRGSFLDLVEAWRALKEQERTYNQQLVSFEQHVVMLEQASGMALREDHMGGTS